MTANVEYSTAAAAARLAGHPHREPAPPAGGSTAPPAPASSSSAPRRCPARPAFLRPSRWRVPSFSIATRVATLAGVPLSATASAGGAAALAELRDSAGTTIVSGLTVGAVGSGAAIELAATDEVVAGETVQITGGAITHP